MTVSSSLGDLPGPGPWQRRPFGAYVLLRKLAEGGMAEIFLARRADGEGAGRDVVIKRMRESLVGQPDFVEMFRQEARVAASLSHPHLVRVYDQGVSEGRPYLCMEFLPGEDFSTVVRLASLRGEYVPVPLVLRVLADAARGLHHAHELDIVHRDVSPSNLYVTYSGLVKVLDFGVAQAGAGSTASRPGSVLGKSVYMAPEQARGGVVDRRADVFALGVSLYEALTHVRPFAREREQAVLEALRKGDCAPPRALRPELSEELEAVVLQAMAVEPSRRHATAAAFADALEALLSREPSAPTRAQLAAHLRASVGERRYQEKTAPPPFVERDPAELVPRRVEAGPGSRRAGWALLAVAGGGVLLGGLAWGWGREPVEVAPVPVVSRAAPEGVVPEVAPAAPLEPPSRASPDAEREAPRGEEKASARVSLEAADIQRVLARHRARVSPCFERHKDDLPTDEGDVRVRFTIHASGKAEPVTEGPLADRPLARCLESRLRRLRFPAHRGGSVSVVLPLGYRVTR
ncbi:protein kinase domain-containing protein [Melittangium boletus]|uniref:Serine/threonine-protein kinase Pkn6 n=1 Tax=Melittangium boletus DSM 14713 TaxID=1294270 RepID=A0A250IKH3_9BACT|nr:protein kinase [Melittangium boletus]ATB31733.1 serine/threonine-protein kinase Pkn6 [Melittangium boletus DSM 14713]